MTNYRHATRGLSIAQRLEFYSIPEPNSGCLLWIGASTPQGYGVLLYEGRQQAAHRVAWKEAKGPIPDGFYACHRCDVKPCINVDHLFLGTHDDNMADMVTKGRSPGGERHGQCKLTEENVRTIFASNRSQRALATQYDVSQRAIWQIKKRIAWRHVIVRAFA